MGSTDVISLKALRDNPVILGADAFVLKHLFGRQAEEAALSVALRSRGPDPMSFLRQVVGITSDGASVTVETGRT